MSRNQILLSMTTENQTIMGNYYNKLNTVVVIPARGGSEEIKNKNIRDFAGKPLIAWTIELALAVRNVSRVIVSTDSKEIAEVAIRFGAEAPFIRPGEISLSSTPIEPVLAHAYEWLRDNNSYNADAIVLLFPTNPLRRIAHVEECIDWFYLNKVDSVFTVNESPAHYTPFWTIVKGSNGRIEYYGGKDIRLGYSRRQDFPIKCYAKNDLVFVLKPENLYQLTPSLFGDNNDIIVTKRIYDGDINDIDDWDSTLARFKNIN